MIVAKFVAIPAWALAIVAGLILAGVLVWIASKGRK